MRDVMAQLHLLNLHSTDRHKELYDCDMLRPLAKSMAQQCTVLCFDEMQMTDVATCALLYRLIHHLMQYGVIVACTSNRHPSQLYRGHFREVMFEPFVQVVKDNCDVVEIKTKRDYRTTALELDPFAHMVG